MTDIRHLFLSHIHLDHAGAAGTIVREHPGLTVWVSEIGAPHLIDPSRLEASARRLYGDRSTRSGASSRRSRRGTSRSRDGDVLGWEAFPTPGPRLAPRLLLSDGTLLAGDACGVGSQPARYVLPATPPPDIDVEAWHATIAEIAAAGPERLALTHFGVETTPATTSSASRPSSTAGRGSSATG